MFSRGVCDLHTTTQRDDSLGHLVNGVAIIVIKSLRVLETEGIALDFEDRFAVSDVLNAEGITGEGEELFFELQFDGVVKDVARMGSAVLQVTRVLMGGRGGIGGRGVLMMGSLRVLLIVMRSGRRLRKIGRWRSPLGDAGGCVSIVPAAVGGLVGCPTGRHDIRHGEAWI